MTDEEQTEHDPLDLISTADLIAALQRRAARMVVVAVWKIDENEEQSGVSCAFYPDRFSALGLMEQWKHVMLNEGVDDPARFHEDDDEDSDESGE